MTYQSLAKNNPALVATFGQLGEVHPALQREQQRLQRPRKAQPPTAYRAIVEACIAVRWPCAYVRDVLLHDLTVLQREQPDSFLWIVRAGGSDLCLPNEEGLGWARTQLCAPATERRWFWWDGNKLIEVSAQDGYARLRLLVKGTHEDE